ncbi:hypothetical protein Q5698_08455 [Brucella intermedia]|uniref:hypothetical protein n=1 Tax=Brucella TaxID=234 RepID=UPI00224B47FF|nr:hypothetical protein [Brucella intermedia]WLF95701.1 hypothetical protein Q5698_08455 [Brucella intermedia]WPM80887.1 hypothetical protein R5W60_04085 [Brucella pseudintermedia]
MTVDKKPRNNAVIIDGDRSSGGDSEGSTLTPTLMGGLVLVVLGGVIVMMFV